jgi:hypothetical protein
MMWSTLLSTTNIHYKSRREFTHMKGRGLKDITINIYHATYCSYHRRTLPGVGLKPELVLLKNIPTTGNPGAAWVHHLELIAAEKL